MARLRRLYIPGYPAHITVRGNNRQEIFRSEGDRVYFHRCLVETTRRFGLAVHAYVFMNNHVHILGTGRAADSLGKVVQCMGRRYGSTPHSLYMELAATQRERRMRYAALFDHAIDPVVLAAIRFAAGKGWALGGEDFCTKLEELSGRPAAPRKGGRPRKGPLGPVGAETPGISLIGV